MLTAPLQLWIEIRNLEQPIGAFIIPLTARYGIANLKSGLLKSFKAALACLLAISCATGGMGQSGKLPVRSQSRPILNIHQITSVGPELADEVSLISPATVITNDIGEIFISDNASNTVYRLSSTLEFLSKEGSPSSSIFNKPLGMACDAALNLYVVDSGNHRIQVLDHNLRFARSISSYSDQNNESVDFTQPSDISIDGEGNFWIADDNKILKLNPFFNLLLEISDQVPSPFIVGKVTSLRVSKRGLVAIADNGNQRIRVISTAGNFISEINVSSPRAVIWDRDDNIWVLEQNKLSAFDLTGIERFSFISDLPGARPVWAAFDPGGRLIIVDGGLRKVGIFEVVRGAENSK
jgi:DNA-binding beta-propeller fold protein YncE